jgi:hypothetical protein
MGFREKLSAVNIATTKIIHETFSRLHRMRYIDIHRKTVMISISTLTPLLMRLVDQGAREGFCTNAHAREFIEIFVAASQFLFDPEYGTERMAERAKAISILTEKAFGLPPGFVDASYMGHADTGK